MANETIQTRIHPETGEVLRRRRRDEVVRFKGLSKTVTVEGWFPEGGGDGVLTEEDARPIDAALLELTAAHKEFVRGLALKVRTSIGLSQEDASMLLTGSRNSFYKYEHGDAEPSRPTLMLMRLLGKRPDLIAELKLVANDDTHAMA
jgi:HTH-type transcriptional regulator/antitoxin MqsA